MQCKRLLEQRIDESGYPEMRGEGEQRDQLLDYRNVDEVARYDDVRLNEVLERCS